MPTLKEKIDTITSQLGVLVKHVDEKTDVLAKQFNRQEQKLAGLSKQMDGRFDQVDSRFGEMNKQFECVDEKLGQMSGQIDQLALMSFEHQAGIGTLNERVGHLENGFHQTFDKLNGFLIILNRHDAELTASYGRQDELQERVAILEQGQQKISP